MDYRAKTKDPNYFVHPQAICEAVDVGEGTRIWAFSHIFPNAHIGRDCNIGENVYIENKVRIGNNVTVKNGVCLWEHVSLEDDVFVGPQVAFTNDFTPRSFIKKRKDELLRPTKVKKGATIGANATIVCGVVIHEYSMIGAGAVITHDVPAHSLVLGIPGTIAGRVCYCGMRLSEKDYCPNCRCELQNNTPEKAAIAAAILR